MSDPDVQDLPRCGATYPWSRPNVVTACQEPQGHVDSPVPAARIHRQIIRPYPGDDRFGESYLWSEPAVSSSSRDS